MTDMAVRLFRRGNEALANKDPARAVRFYNRSLELRPGVMEVLTNKAGALMDMRRYPEALETIDEAIETMPEYAKLHGMRGDILYYLGRYDESEESFNRGIKLDSRIKAYKADLFGHAPSQHRYIFPKREEL